MIFMLAYDIFWLFISRETFGSDISKVDGSQIETPFKIALPRMMDSPYTNCARINLGDVVFPSMLIRYLRTLDIRRTDKRTSYCVVSFLGYALGQTLWTVSHLWATTPLPPFIYITPLSLGATLIYGIWIGDIRNLMKSKVMPPLEIMEDREGSPTAVNDSYEHIRL